MHDKPIRVSVYRPADRKFFYIKWTNPETGKIEKQSTGTNIRRDADRFANKREKELNDGVERPGRRTTWDDFRVRVERDFLPRKRPKTQARYKATMNAVERHLTVKLLTGLNSAALGEFEGALRARGNADATIAAQLRHLKSLLRWGHRNKLLPHVPHIEIPAVETTARGRPITDEEFERVLKAAPEVVGEGRAESWRYLLRGLFVGGLRIGEALRLTWDDPQGIRVDVGRAYPLLFIPGRFQKGKKDTVTPITPDFAALLAETSDVDRRGYVFEPAAHNAKRTERLSQSAVEGIISQIGEEAGVVVKREPQEFASAHDLRRSFCFRWAQRVLPQVLKTLARHKSINTTLEFYAEADAEMTAEAVWAAVAALPGPTSGPTSQRPRREGVPETQ